MLINQMVLIRAANFDEWSRYNLLAAWEWGSKHDRPRGRLCCWLLFTVRTIELSKDTHLYGFQWWNRFNWDAIRMGLHTHVSQVVPSRYDRRSFQMQDLTCIRSTMLQIGVQSTLCLFLDALRSHIFIQLVQFCQHIWLWLFLGSVDGSCSRWHVNV